MRNSRGRDDLQLKLQDLLDNWFHRYRREWPDEARWGRDELIGELRRLLAGVCIRALEPDLVILDEFQRFKPLIETREDRRSPAAEIAQSLFQTKAHDGRPVPTLLLSATPYKLYTTDAEIEQEDHYEDFLATTRFLYGGRENRVETLASGLARFGNALKRATPDDSGSLQAVGQRQDGRRACTSSGDGQDREGSRQRRAGRHVERARSKAVSQAGRRAPVSCGRRVVRSGRRPGPDAVLEVGALSGPFHARLQVQRAAR